MKIAKCEPPKKQCFHYIHYSIISLLSSKKVTKSMFYLQLEAMYAHFSCSMQCCKHSAQLYVNQRNR